MFATRGVSHFRNPSVIQIVWELTQISLSHDNSSVIQIVWELTQISLSHDNSPQLLSISSYADRFRAT
ncbi:hypothetical protein [Leptospira ellisii]|uniref:hypothetical protein n=1 Tax=Leptospira ellisii TaxID=2023197 RepID=UPI000C2A44ED|nr:hypothetical protein [Leptospira ellisii]PKA06159.1 hypothetical protein CH375_01255 [Leptospira ellisii]